MKVALVHDFLIEYGGAERVLEALHEIWPKAPVYTAYYDFQNLGPHRERLESWDIRTSWAQKIPGFGRFLSPGRILAPLLFESFDLKKYDLVISSTNTYFAKAVLTSPKQLHISYCHTPPRYLYGYPTAREWRKYFFGRLFGSIMNHFLRIFDYSTAQRVDYFIANSQNTKERIKKFWRRDAKVIYPPADLGKFIVHSSQFTEKKKKDTVNRERITGNYYLCVSRLYRPKRVDLAVLACKKLGLPLKIVGTGREEENLRKIAGPKTEFLGELSDSELAQTYQNCRAVIFPAEEEDFGIVPVEAQAAGKPVIALRSGGVTESVIEGKTGVFFDEPKVESLVKAIKQLSNEAIKSEDCILNVKKFSKERFKKEIKDFSLEKLAKLRKES